jgi:hypothetical protein
VSGKLVPGQVPSELFEGLLEGTDIRSKRAIAALRDHFVVGLPSRLAYEKHSAPKSQFYLLVATINAESERVRNLAKFY